MSELSQEEIDTLANYAVRRGHTWKARLLASWEHGVPASMRSIYHKLGKSGVKSIDTERLIASASRSPRSALDMSMARFNPSPERSTMARKFVHTARYHVNKGGRIVGYHRSYTLALKHRRRLGKGARIVDTQGFDVLEGAALKKYRTTKKRAKRTAKKGCACPPKRKAAKRTARRNPQSVLRRLELMPPQTTRTIAGAKVKRIGHNVFELSWRGHWGTHTASAAAEILEDRAEAKRGTRGNPSVVGKIRAGDRVTIVTPHGQERSGKAVMRGPHGWVLNMGGRYGTPGIASDSNIVKVSPRKR